MKNLNLEQMEIIEGGECEGQIAAFALAGLAIAASAVTFNPIGMAFAAASMATAIYNLEECQNA